MAGILNNKTRIMDVIITAEGKRQLGRGNFRPEFASFTDRGAFYEADTLSGSTDARDRILFEATSLPADKIFLEYDDSGRLIGSPDVKLNPVGVNNSILVRDENGTFNLAKANDFAVAAQTMITGSIKNLSNHQLLSSYNPSEFNTLEFDISRRKIEFVIDNFRPFGKNPNQKSANINNIEPFMTDKRLSHLHQFKFLPPVRDDGLLLGNYEDLNQKEILTFDELMQEIGKLPHESLDVNQMQNDLSIFGPLEDAFVNAALSDNSDMGRPRESIKFSNTTTSNNMFAQCFEVDLDGPSRRLEKLSVIDYGTFIDNNNKHRPEKHVFFVGKVYRGIGGFPTFVNLFTLVFD